MPWCLRHTTQVQLRCISNGSSQSHLVLRLHTSFTAALMTQLASGNATWILASASGEHGAERSPAAGGLSPALLVSSCRVLQALTFCGLLTAVWHARFTASANLHEGAIVANYPYDGHPDGDEDLKPVNNPTPDDATFRHLAKAYAAAHAFMSASKVRPCEGMLAGVPAGVGNLLLVLLQGLGCGGCLMTQEPPTPSRSFPTTCTALLLPVHWRVWLDG